MNKRIAIAALVGVLTFLTIYIELTLIHAHGAISRHPHASLVNARWVALMYATLFGALSAAITFAASFALHAS